MSLYLENRPKRTSLEGMAADLARHMRSRQSLGTILVVHGRPREFKDALYRQWLKISRSLQEDRAESRDAEEILRLTTIITRMQHINLSCERPQDDPGAQVYCLDDTRLGLLPANIYTVYLAGHVSSDWLAGLSASLPDGCLIVDYCKQIEVESLELAPRTDLEDLLERAWVRVSEFLDSCGLSAHDLVGSAANPMGGDDRVLDTILGRVGDFSAAADDFMKSMALARPLRGVAVERRGQYEAFARLIGRVETLTPGAKEFFHLDLDDSFLLHDRPYIYSGLVQSSLERGRLNIARVLLT